MLNKKQLIEHYHDFVNEYKLNPRDIVVNAGGAMVLLGLRKETSDIDVTVTKMIFERFKEMGKPTHVFPATGASAAVEAVEATELLDLHIGEREFRELGCIHGVWHDSAETVLEFKRRLNRPKDQEDIKALEKHLSRTRLKPW